MLELIRQHRNLFSTIFVFSAAGMVFTMFGERGDSQSGGMGLFSSGVAASVEGREISTRELTERLERRLQDAQRAMSDQVKGMGGNAAENRKFIEQLIQAQVTPDAVLGELIRERFLDATADAAGIVVPKEAILEAIRAEKAFQKDGKFDAVTYKQLVPEPGPFERRVATQAKMQQFSHAFVDGFGVISPDERRLEEAIRAKRVFEIVQVQPKSFPEPKAVSPAEIEAFAKDAANQPKLQSYFDRNVTKFQSEEKIRARHILVKDEKVVQDIAKDIAAKKISFEDAAKKHSEDKSNAAKGGDLDYFPRGMMDPAFEQAAFALKAPQDISQPVKSSFGWHLIQLVDRKAAAKKNLDEVKGEIAGPALLEIKRAEAGKKWVDGVIASGKAPAEAELKKYGLSWAKQNPWAPVDGALGSLGTVDSHLKALLALNKEQSFLKSSLNVGENLVLVRWVETQPAEYTAGDKTEGAFQYYLQTRYETLEKNKKIRRSDAVIQSLSTQIKARAATR